jgi:serine/threonine protein kinase
MKDDVRRLFHEVLDLPACERERLFQERAVETALRSEVECLLRLDADNIGCLTNCVSRAAQDVLSSSNEWEPDCGPYRLIRLLGTGGMGAVYLAERMDGEIQQRVAIKFLGADCHRAVSYERFLRERQVLASLNHPSIVHVIDAGHTRDRRPYLVMEYVAGIPIDIYSAGLALRDTLELFVRVCEAVSHAHQRLVIHRDLKPSNILVNDGGQPKVLDFGIAKLLDESGAQTQTLEWLLTPTYASPEQLSGTQQTTSTDVYSLGAVLYKLLTSRSPNEVAVPSSEANTTSPNARNIPPPTTLNPALPSDIDYIMGKVLRTEPEERYRSVDAFASDLRAVLQSRPVQARSGDTWYRARKFLRRYWIPMAAAIMVVASLSMGLYVANQQRVVAQHRFQQVRDLANKVLALDVTMQSIQGATAARHQIVSISLEYLKGLSADAQNDRTLALEIANAYTQVALVQGLPSGSNLGMLDEADASLAKAETLVEFVLKSEAGNRRALLASAQIAHDRMIIASTKQRREDVLTQARRVLRRTDEFLGLGNPSESEVATVARLLCNVGMSHYNMRLYNEAMRYSQRTVQVSQQVEAAERYRGLALSIMATSLRCRGDLGGALRTIREAEHVTVAATYPGETARRTALHTILLREGMILGQDDNISLDRRAEAIRVFQRSFDLIEGMAVADPKDSRSRIFEAGVGLELAAISSRIDANRALAIYDHCLARLREVMDSAKVRREEVRQLAGSSYVLRKLHRASESRTRIEAALRLLQQTRDYPAEKIDLDSEAEVAVRALADHQSETGQLKQAAETYRELLEKVMASKPEPKNDLLQANNLSRIYRGLANLYCRMGRSDEANAIGALRVDLWRHWDSKLPNNSFVLRQLTAARSH